MNIDLLFAVQKRQNVPFLEVLASESRFKEVSSESLSSESDQDHQIIGQEAFVKMNSMIKENSSANDKLPPPFAFTLLRPGQGDGVEIEGIPDPEIFGGSWTR